MDPNSITPDLFDTAQRRKEEGQSQVLANESNHWREKALVALKQFAQWNFEFTAEDFKDQALDRLGPPHHPNVWGGLFRMAAKRGWIKKKDMATGRTLASHGHYLYVWESQIHQVRES